MTANDIVAYGYAFIGACIVAGVVRFLYLVFNEKEV